MPDIHDVVEAALYVDDLDRAEAFYRDVLGLRVVGKKPGRHVFFEVGDGLLLIFDPESTRSGGAVPAHGARGAGHVALGIAFADLEAWRARLSVHKVGIEQEVDWPPGGKSLYFRDPDGNSVELITPGCWDLPSGW